MTYAENLTRSSVVPQTIASETAQNMNWNSMNAAVEPTISSPASVPPMLKKKPESPNSQPPPPNASAKPQTHHAIVAIEKLATIFAMPMPAFLPRENPISRNAKPACMNITRTAATRIHVTLSSSTTVVIEVVSICPPRGETQPPPVSGGAADRSLSPC